jgi:hypothetical protein
VRIIVLGLLLPLLFACDKQRQIDCTQVDWRSLERCMDANKSKGEAAMLTACLPFSEPLKTTGVWVIGFERNDFFEGPKPPPVQTMWEASTGAELVVDEKIYKWKPKPEQSICGYLATMTGTV